MTYNHLRELSIEVMESQIQQINQQFNPLIEAAQANGDSFQSSLLICKKRYLLRAAFDQRVKDEESIYLLEVDAESFRNCLPYYPPE